MSEENEVDTESFQAAPELAEKIIKALEESEVEGFVFNKMMPRVDGGLPPLRPKDGGPLQPIETGWTTWRLGG